MPGEIELDDDAIFGLDPRQDLIQRCVVWQLAKRRAGYAQDQDPRAEINRTTKKMVSPKKARARHVHAAPRSAPLFVGGGKAMAPVVRSHEFDLPKKVRAAGLRHALSAKAKGDQIMMPSWMRRRQVKTKTKALAPAAEEAIWHHADADRGWRV